MGSIVGSTGEGYARRVRVRGLRLTLAGVYAGVVVWFYRAELSHWRRVGHPAEEGRLARGDEMREDRTSFESWATDAAGGHGPTSDLTISEATEQDLAGCVALAGVVSDGPPDEWAALFRRNIRRSDRYLVVARTGGDLIAYGRAAWFEPDADTPANAAPAGYYLIGLVVDPRWRRRGIASAIIQARLDWIAQRASEAWYFADASNEVSIWLHERAGFETVTDDFWFPTVTAGRGSHLLGRVQLPTG